MQRVIHRNGEDEERGGEEKSGFGRGASSESDGGCDRGAEEKRGGFETKTRLRSGENEREFSRGRGKLESEEKRTIRCV
jgi:hypothetical protein